jgi:hypothetical protein
MVFCPALTNAQCLCSVNPVGGTENLVVLKKNSLRVISFYKSGYTGKYFDGNRPVKFDLLGNANYNYLSTTLSYGITKRLSIEAETGYFFNKTLNYNLGEAYSLTGRGLSNLVLSAIYSLYSNAEKRFNINGFTGAKIPFSRELLWSDNVKLPMLVQPTSGAYGYVMGLSVVKENTSTGMRYFFSNRLDINSSNNDGYKMGTSVFTSLYISKNLMYPWLKGDWTAIFQVRNETRGIDRIHGEKKASSENTIFFIAPQLNYVTKHEWNISFMIDLPVYQYFKGVQMGGATGFTLVLSKAFFLSHNVSST